MADSPVVLTWNVTNWITVVLMAVLGFTIIKVIAGGVQNARDKMKG